MGYKFQFVTLAGFHSLNHGMFELASGYRDRGMAAYSELQQAEFAAEAHGYTATRHQREVGTGYFDLVAQTVSGGDASTTALAESTEAAQFITAWQRKRRHDDQAILGDRRRISRLRLPRAGPRHREDGRPLRRRAEARTEWTRLSCCPESKATTRYSIAAETIR